MSNKEKIELFLKTIMREAKENKKINYHHIYNKLTIPNSNYPPKLIRDNFLSWIDYYQKENDIDVYMTSENAYFCHFDSIIKPNEDQIPIKMYIAIKPEYIKQFAIELFNYMKETKICHNSKISSDVRYDELVVRAYSIQDIKLIKEFIINNRELKNMLMESDMLMPNPFAYNDSSLSFTIDGKESYNTIIAIYISMYIDELRDTNELDKVSYKGFLEYVNNIYKGTFITGNILNTYINKMKIYENQEDTLLDHEIATSVLLMLMSEEIINMDTFIMTYDKLIEPHRLNAMKENIGKLIKQSKDNKLSDTKEFPIITKEVIAAYNNQKGK